MRVLYFDSLFPRGHRKYNVSMVELISKKYDLDVIDYNNHYYDANLPENCHLITIPGDKEIIQSGIKGRLRSYSLIKRCKKIFRKGNYDALVIASFDIYVMFLANHFFKKRDNVILIHHNTVDQMAESKFKRICFNCYKNKYKHVVLEDFIANYLLSKNIFKSNLYVIYQPLTFRSRLVVEHAYTYNAVSLSNSVDENFLNDIIQQEANLHLLEKNGLRIIIKSNTLKSESNSIIIIKGFISDADYEQLEFESEYILLFYPKSFLFRASDILKNAMSNGKKILCSGFMLANSYARLYPETCIIINSYEELINELKSNRVNRTHEHEKFLNQRNDEVVLSQMGYCIEK